MVKLIHLNIPLAVTVCLQMAAKIEVDLNKLDRRHSHDVHRETLRSHLGHYVKLAEDIEGLKYLSASSVASLVAANGFLKEYVR